MERIGGEGASAVEARLQGLFVLGLKGDGDAYRAFLGQLTTHLRAFARRRLSGLPDDVEDLVQETLLAVHNQRQTYDPRQPLTPWVHAIAQYKITDLFRRRSTREALTEPLDDVQEFLSYGDEEAGSAQRDVTKLLDQLPDRFRLPIIHMKLQGLSVTETARATGMSESAVKVGVHRGLKALAALIRDKA